MSKHVRNLSMKKLHTVFAVDRKEDDHDARQAVHPLLPDSLYGAHALE
jgi:hypothetical protein